MEYSLSLSKIQSRKQILESLIQICNILTSIAPFFSTLPRADVTKGKPQNSRTAQFQAFFGAPSPFIDLGCEKNRELCSRHPSRPSSSLGRTP